MFTQRFQWFLELRFASLMAGVYARKFSFLVILSLTYCTGYLLFLIVFSYLPTSAPVVPCCITKAATVRVGSLIPLLDRNCSYKAPSFIFFIDSPTSAFVYVGMTTPGFVFLINFYSVIWYALMPFAVHWNFLIMYVFITDCRDANLCFNFHHFHLI